MRTDIFSFAKKHKHIFISFGLNILIFLILMTVFEPSVQSDDYDMSNILYGGMNGKYSLLNLYICNILQYIFTFLLKICPDIAWYGILQWFSAFISLCTISYILLKKSMTNRGIICSIIFSFFAGYECYILLTFSKTASILIIAGVLTILYGIDLEFDWKKIIYGGLLVFGGMLWRTLMILPILTIFFSAFVIHLLYSEKKNHIKKTVVFISAVLFSMAVFEGLLYLNQRMLKGNGIWAEYINNNSARAMLFDYDIPDYDTYSDEYEELGISKNDFQLYFEKSFLSDPELLTIDKMEKIRGFEQIGNPKIISRIREALPSWLSFSMLSNLSLCCFFICIFVFLICSKKNKLKILALIILSLSFSYVYMYCRGRVTYYIQNMLFLCSSLLLLYYSCTSEQLNRKQTHSMICVVAVVIFTSMCFRYNQISSSDYYGTSFGYVKSHKEKVEKDNEKLSLLSEDENHFYLISAYETNVLYTTFLPFEVIPKNFYHNIYRWNQYFWPPARDILKKYDVKNPLAEITNSDTMYYGASKYCESNINFVIKYINEHYDKKAKYAVVKQIDNVKIYRFYSGDIEPTWNENNVVYDANIESDISVQKNKDGSYTINGYAFIDGVDSYAQNIYVSAVNNKFGKVTYTYGTQTENDLFITEDKYHGRYSSFTATIKHKGKASDVSLFLYIDTEDKTYKLPLQIKE